MEQQAPHIQNGLQAKESARKQEHLAISYSHALPFLGTSHKSVRWSISCLLPLKPANEVLAYVRERVVTAILKEEILERVKFEFGTPDVRVRRLGSEEPVADPEGLSTGFIVRGAEGGMHGLKV